MAIQAPVLLKTKTDRFSWRRAILALFSSVGLIKATATINRSSIRILIYFHFLSFTKVLLFKKKEVDGKVFSTDTIKTFFDEVTNGPSKHILPALPFSVGIEGSGILSKPLHISYAQSSQLHNTVIREIKRNMPMADAGTIFRYKVLRSNDNSANIIVVLLKKEFLDSLIKLFQERNLQIESVKILSLQMMGIPRASEFGIFIENKNFSGAAYIENKAVKHLNINHDANTAKAFEKVQTYWESAMGKEANTKAPVFFLREDSRLPVQISSFNRVDGNRLLKQLIKVPIELSTYSSAELFHLTSSQSLSPEILPDELYKKSLKKKRSRQLLFYFLLFQFFTPLIFMGLQAQREFLLRETRFTVVNKDIQESKLQYQELFQRQSELIELLKFIKKSDSSNSDFLQKLANSSIKDLVINRINKTAKTIQIQGYALDIQVLSVFMEELERNFGNADFELKKTAQKGQAISFAIQWKLKRK